MYATIISFLTCGLVQPQRKARKAHAGSQLMHVATCTAPPVAASTPLQRQTPMADVVKGAKSKPARRPVRNIFPPSSSESRISTPISSPYSQSSQVLNGMSRTASPRCPISPATASTVSSSESAAGTSSLTEAGSSDDVIDIAVFGELNDFQTFSTCLTMDTLDGVYRRFGHLGTRDKPSIGSAPAFDKSRPIKAEVDMANGFQTASTSMTMDTLDAKYRRFGHLTLRENPTDSPLSAATSAASSTTSLEWHGIINGFKTTSTSMTLDTLDGKYRRFGHVTFRDSSTESSFSAASPSSRSPASSEQGDSINGLKTTSTVMTMDTLDCAYRRFGHLTLREAQSKPPHCLSAPPRTLASSDM